MLTSPSQSDWILSATTRSHQITEVKKPQPWCLDLGLWYTTAHLVLSVVTVAMEGSCLRFLKAKTADTQPQLTHSMGFLKVFVTCKSQLQLRTSEKSIISSCLKISLQLFNSTHHFILK